MTDWLSERELLDQAGLSEAELRWFSDRFAAQMRCLTARGPGGEVRYAPDTVLLLRNLSAMVAQGATPEQIRTWFGL
ncbi:hypothetical protein [Symbiobacterium terraclitae]|uniref:hypothetical protein n=1 Tax=Symbiobacterium terraclitae TaxID=557451 RepID=UPI0035B502A8